MFEGVIPKPRAFTSGARNLARTIPKRATIENRLSLPQKVNAVKNPTWQIYRTRFLIKAKPLTEPLAFVDSLGREHRGQPGDYLIESSDGSRSIQRREVFEDIYVPMGLAEATWPACQRDVGEPDIGRSHVTPSVASA